MTGGYSIKEVISMDNIRAVTKSIIAEAASEACDIDVEKLHYTLLGLPAEKYLELYKLMSEALPHVH